MRRVIETLLLALLCSSAVCAQNGAITIDVHDAYLTDVLALLGAQAGMNIVADNSVKPEHVTLHLRDVSFDVALAVLIQSHGLQVHRQGNVLIVGEADAMNRRYDATNSVLGAQTEVLSLNHAKPGDIAKELTDALPPGTVIVADERTLSVMVTGDLDTVARARRLVSAFDIPGATGANGAINKAYHLRYVRVDDAIKQLKILAPAGVYVADDLHNAVVVSGGNDVQSEVTQLFRTLDQASPQVLFEVKVADVTPLNDDSNVGLEWGGVDFSGRQSVGSGTYTFAGGAIPINVKLNAMITEGRARILATPKLVTVNNKEADLLIGQTYPIVYNTSVLGGQNVQFVDIGVKLRLTPTIGQDGVVTAELHPEYSELLGVTQTGYPIVANRRIDSTLRVTSDSTIVLGGLMRDVDNQTVERIPWLSQVPVLGKFFENKQSHRERDEIVFLITPHVIKPDEAPPSH